MKSEYGPVLLVDLSKAVPDGWRGYSSDAGSRSLSGQIFFISILFPVKSPRQQQHLPLISRACVLPLPSSRAHDESTVHIGRLHSWCGRSMRSCYRYKPDGGGENSTSITRRVGVKGPGEKDIYRSLSSIKGYCD